MSRLKLFFTASLFVLSSALAVYAKCGFAIAGCGYSAVACHAEAFFVYTADEPSYAEVKLYDKDFNFLVGDYKECPPDICDCVWQPWCCGEVPEPF
ncbi:MAG: hypothetical protein QNK37_38895 [Acidobacteriota bacterium]|nr:hypothetical protein [Acidobacteriota bacterium]